MRITTGFVEPHFFAGFSGGPKLVAPGLAGLETVLVLHDAARIGDPRATWGVIEGNPVHDDVRAIAAATGVTFALDVVLNRDQEIVAAFGGDLLPMHAAATRRRPAAGDAPGAERRSTSWSPPTPAIPLDQNLYQAVKGMSAGLPGGPAGRHDRLRRRVPRRLPRPRLLPRGARLRGRRRRRCSTTIARPRRDRARPVAGPDPGPHPVRHAGVVMHTSYLTDADLAAAHLEQTDDIAATVAEALRRPAGRGAPASASCRRARRPSPISSPAAPGTAGPLPPLDTRTRNDARPRLRPRRPRPRGAPGAARDRLRPGQDRASEIAGIVTALLAPQHRPGPGHAGRAPAAEPSWRARVRAARTTRRPGCWSGGRRHRASFTVAVVTAGTVRRPGRGRGGGRRHRARPRTVSGPRRRRGRAAPLLAAAGRPARGRRVIVVAGMEGALASVVGGLVETPVIAVPTSTGYGAALEGVTALLAMLTSCAAGLTVVNIDSGFGAALAAYRLTTRASRPPTGPAGEEVPRTADTTTGAYR